MSLQHCFLQACRCLGKLWCQWRINAEGWGMVAASASDKYMRTMCTAWEKDVGVGDKFIICLAHQANALHVKIR
jgi:hypothetical protein